ncbi:MAG: metal-dependent transcriptional regulator [Rhodoglobus sp.]|nr:metal-dependent transcriptional regulator [Rhodoglobus sp.]
MSVSDLSPSTQNYLKAVWSIAEWSTEPVTPTLIAERTGLRVSSVSDGVKRMAGQGLVEHAPYGAVTLTDRGRALALAMVRRHRLIETFLVRTLGYSWDQVHDEAENLEHAVSDFLVDRIDELLEFPTRDPHGDPIPTSDGTIDLPDATQLTLLGTDVDVVVERISDGDPELLQFFQEHGIVLGARLHVGPGAAYSGSLTVTVSDAAEPLALGRLASDALYASVLSS